jgi:hypothetical protein
MQLRRMKIDGLHHSALPGNSSAADFFSVPEHRGSFAPAAPGRSAAGKCHPLSLVQSLMAGGGGSTLPSGVVALGHEKRAIESLLQNVGRALSVFIAFAVRMRLIPCRGTFLPLYKVLQIASGRGQL